MAEGGGDELVLMRREMDRQRQERIDHLEHRFDEMTAMITEMSRQMTTIIERQTQYGPTMDTLQTVMRGGVMLKWIIVLAVGTLAAISTGATAWDAMQRFFK
jgi:TolA-binding protein